MLWHLRSLRITLVGGNWLLQRTGVFPWHTRIQSEGVSMKCQRRTSEQCNQSRVIVDVGLVLFSSERKATVLSASPKKMRLLEKKWEFEVGFVWKDLTVLQKGQDCVRKRLQRLFKGYWVYCSWRHGWLLLRHLSVFKTLVFTVPVREKETAQSAFLTCQWENSRRETSAVRFPLSGWNTEVSLHLSHKAGRYLLMVRQCLEPTDYQCHNKKQTYWINRQ